MFHVRWRVPSVRGRKTKMHNVHPGSHPRVLPGSLELLPGWQEFLPGWLESVFTQSRLRKVKNFSTFLNPVQVEKS